MLRNYFKIALRNLLKNKIYSLINIGGLTLGMVVAMLIGLWIDDELSFDKYHKNYDRIAQVGFTNTMNGEENTWPYVSIPLGTELRNSYGNDFKHVVMASFNRSHILTFNDTKFQKSGTYIEPQAIEMLSLKITKGSQKGLNEPASILLSESVAKAYFGDNDPIHKLMTLDHDQAVKVTGVYEDFPANSSFAEVSFLTPWQLQPWLKDEQDNWDGHSSQIYVQLAENADCEAVTKKIKDVLVLKGSPSEAQTKSQLLLHPMKKWHLYQTFKNGVMAGGSMENLWLFGFIGGFVLLLACINFINLSTARSEKRAKEVGIRKAVGSMRGQLIIQFFGESLFVVVLAFVLTLLLVQLTLPYFNELAAKQIIMPWGNPYFWLIGACFGMFTALLSGIYPAIYLSSFQPVKVLKSSLFVAGRFSGFSRKALVVVQFTVSVTLIIGTIVVYRQIQFAQNRPMGYDRNGLVMVDLISQDFHQHFEVAKDELIKSGAVVAMAESEMPATKVLGVSTEFDWEGKDANLPVKFPIPGVSFDYGKTVGWAFKEGRDFSKNVPSDKDALILNESAVKFIGLQDPHGKTIRWKNKPYQIIGVIKDMVMESPYAPVRPSFFYLELEYAGVINLKLNPAISASTALSRIETVFKKYNPSEPFNYKFVDQEFAKKFATEERIGQLASLFAILAILISCLGLFGLSSFVAEQRIKEIGIRKVMGASVAHLWRMLSKDFVVLVVVSCVIAIPVAYYLMNAWLQKYDYHTEISWWIFVVTSLLAVGIALITVSYQAIKAALMNPVKSLKTD